MKIRTVILTTVMMIVAVIGQARAASSESAFDRIQRTKTVRCGYVSYQPGLVKDAATGQFSGIIYDIMESVAKKLDLKVEWTEETTWGLHLEGLKTGRYDVLCAASFALPSDTVWSETVGPLYYSAIGVWVRPGDERFLKDYAAINKPDVTVSAVDGTIPAIIAAEDFPSAHIVSLPQFSDYSLNMQNVAQGKADVTFVETWQGNAFLHNKPVAKVMVIHTGSRL